MENKEFKTDYVLDLEKYNEFVSAFSATNLLRKILKVLIVVYFSYFFLISFIITKDYRSIMFFAILLLLIFLINYKNKKNGNLQYKRMLSVNKGNPVHNEITIKNDGIHALNVDTQNKSEYTFEQIKYVIESSNLLILMMDYRLGLIMDKNTLTGGTTEELVNFIFENATNIKRKKVRKARSNKIISVIGFIVLIMILCTAILFQHKQQKDFEHPFEDENFIDMSNNEKTYQALANILQEVGINDIPTEMIQQLEQEWEDYPEDIMLDKMAILLSSIGDGDYDYKTGKWIPSSNKIYSFDMECYDIDNMYQLLFEGLASISNKELKFSNVSVDTSKVDYDNGGGTLTVKFDLNDKTYTYLAQYYNDWYDVGILDFINNKLKEENNSKQLYFMEDGYQTYIVFYCDREWANVLEEKTECELDTNAKIE